MAKLTKRDLQMLKMTCEMELPLVAERLEMKLDAVHQRYYWIRQKRREAQKFVNICNNAEKICPKLRKLLITQDLAKKGEGRLANLDSP